MLHRVLCANLNGPVPLPKDCPSSISNPHDSLPRAKGSNDTYEPRSFHILCMIKLRILELNNDSTTTSNHNPPPPINSSTNWSSSGNPPPAPNIQMHHKRRVHSTKDIHRPRRTVPFHTPKGQHQQLMCRLHKRAESSPLLNRRILRRELCHRWR